ncbi:putative ribonuclease H-like domain-containing protein [Tanacetum coccineum]
MLKSTGVICSTSASRSKPSSNTKNNRISQSASSNKTNKVKDHSRSVKSRKNKKNHVDKTECTADVLQSMLNANSISEPISNALVKHSVRNAKVEALCASCNKRLFDFNHDKCFIEKDIRCPLTRITSKIVPPKDSPSAPVKTSDLKVKFLRSKDEVLAFAIKFLKMIQVRLNATVRNIRTDNGTEFVNQTLREYYEDVGITHQTSVARTPQQNSIVERRNRTLVEAARTMLIFLKAPLFLWAKAFATACYTQNQSLIRKRHNKTPYKLLHDRKLDLYYLHVFGALCYPINDGEDLRKLRPKADIRIFVGYAPAKKAFRIYKKWTRLIIETIHVDFDELIAMASEQFSSGLGPKLLTPRTISSGLVQNIPSSTPYVPPTKDDWEIPFQPMFDEYLNPSPYVNSQVPADLATEPVVSTGTPSSTTIDQDALSASTSQTTPETPPPVIPLSVEKDDHDIEVAHIDKSPSADFQIPEPSSEESSSQLDTPVNVFLINQPPELLGIWTKSHPIANVIGDPSRSASTRKKLKTNAMWCYFHAFLTSVKPSNFKEAITEPSWIDAMQEEIHEFQ